MTISSVKLTLNILLLHFHLHSVHEDNIQYSSIYSFGLFSVNKCEKWFHMCDDMMNNCSFTFIFDVFFRLYFFSNFPLVVIIHVSATDSGI